MTEPNVLAKIIPAGELTAPEYREWIFSIEEKMQQCEQSVDRHAEDNPLPTKHTFTPGLYTRQITMPATSLVISRIHLHEHPFVISKGRVSVYDGKEIVVLEAPHQGVTPAGTKRILYVHEDTVWTTFHVTDKSSFDEIDINGVITCDTFEEFEQIAHKEIPIWHG